uniref:Uncharacterized protein n=1 Tax=Magnusiomyces tetraspermus TaxID=1232584 RepID=A0A023UMB3_9ASCO|nr:hypothetical protein [Magnusiomyces tetraspermus]AHY04939.1 hypothetical protein [Magnusiomyces tetraspermus]
MKMSGCSGNYVVERTWRRICSKMCEEPPPSGGRSVYTPFGLYTAYASHKHPCDTIHPGVSPGRRECSPSLPPKPPIPFRATTTGIGNTVHANRPTGTKSFGFRGNTKDWGPSTTRSQVGPSGRTSTSGPSAKYT